MKCFFSDRDLYETVQVEHKKIIKKFEKKVKIIIWTREIMRGRIVKHI